MKYIVFPTEKLNEVSQKVLDELHIVPRKSVDGTEVIMKVVNYEKLFPSVINLSLDDEESQEPIYSYPTYESEALTTLLESNKWNEPTDSVLDTPSVLSDTLSSQTSSKKSTKSTVL